jgi:uridine kinase
MIIGISGKIGAGKSTTAEYLASKLNEGGKRQNLLILLIESRLLSQHSVTYRVKFNIHKKERI